MISRQWLRYHEIDGGSGYAEPDGWIEFSNFVLLIEVKLTGVAYGHAQMTDLYGPLLEHLLGKPVRKLMICRGVNPATPGPFVNSVEDFLQGDLPIATWHFLI